MKNKRFIYISKQQQPRYLPSAGSEDLGEQWKAFTPQGYHGVVITEIFRK